jgi:hypothetical protein
VVVSGVPRRKCRRCGCPLPVAGGSGGPHGSLPGRRTKTLPWYCNCRRRNEPLAIAAAYDPPTLIASQDGDLNMAMSDWMSNLNPDLTLDQITMPGSHDAGVYEGGTSSVKFAPKSTSVAQYYDVYGQCFYAGSRFFDVRVQPFSSVRVQPVSSGFLQKETELRALHLDQLVGAFGGKGEPLDSMLNGVKLFLEHRPTEFVILRFTKCKNHDEIIERVQRLCGNKLFKQWGYLAKARVGDMKGHVIAAFDAEFGPALQNQTDLRPALQPVPFPMPLLPPVPQPLPPVAFPMPFPMPLLPPVPQPLPPVAFPMPFPMPLLPPVPVQMPPPRPTTPPPLGPLDGFHSFLKFEEAANATDGLITCGSYAASADLNDVVLKEDKDYMGHDGHNGPPHIFVLYWTQTVYGGSIEKQTVGKHGTHQNIQHITTIYQKRRANAGMPTKLPTVVLYDFVNDVTSDEIIKLNDPFYRQ